VGKRIKLIAIIVLVLIALAAVAYYVFITYFSTDPVKESAYESGVELIGSGSYEQAISVLSDIEDYKDSASKIREAEDGIKDNKLNSAIEYMDNGNYDMAILTLEELGEWKDSLDYLNQSYLMRENDFTDRIANAVYSIYKYKDIARALCIAIESAWISASNSGEDVATAINAVMAGNEAAITSLNSGVSEIQSDIDNSTDSNTVGVLGEGKTKALFETVESLNETFNKIYNQAINPSGSINDYSKLMKDYNDEFHKIFVQLGVQIPRLNDVIAEAKLQDELKRIEEASPVIVEDTENPEETPTQ
jgi:tetratricopeptide (TPR) repeat protein